MTSLKLSLVTRQEFLKQKNDGYRMHIVERSSTFWGKLSPEQAAESHQLQVQLQGCISKMYQMFANGLQYIGSTAT